VASAPLHARAAAVLPTEPTQAKRFGKARTAQSTALLEDYVELIADLLASSGDALLASLQRKTCDLSGGALA
jgi:DtxR family manganese transport transcriptional regulator